MKSETFQGFIILMLPIGFCCFGIILSHTSPILGLITASIGLPLWLYMRTLIIVDPIKDRTSKLPITSGESS